jgi:mono/diheme cytochrome c family protein
MLVLTLSLLACTAGHTDQATQSSASSELGNQVERILRTHCYRCHGQDGSAEGGLDFVLDAKRLVTSGKVVAGKPAESPLWRMVEKGAMPPRGEEPQLSDADKQLLRRWIGEGASAWSRPQRPSLGSQKDIFEAILADLSRLGHRQRRFQRYFSLQHLAQAGASPEEIARHRQAVSKVLNSLSWHPNITRPQALDDQGLLLRIDLRDFLWDAATWNRLLAEYPYATVPGSMAGLVCCVATGTRIPVVRGDWFVATASRAPLYYDLLQLPSTAAELERQLRVDAALNIAQERVARAGFNNSGVSRNNRLIERHYAAHGAYWRSYDFEALPQNLAERQNLLPDRRNLFAFPLGPGFAENSFLHAGGEIIFHLPNGMFGYMLVDGQGNRIAKGPISIVSDPARPDRTVEAAVSCMSCHATGIHFKDDQIRDHVSANPAAFKPAEIELVRSLYVPKETMRKLMQEDADQYQQAVEKAGAGTAQPEPVRTCTRRYEAPLDVEQAAAELAVPLDHLRMSLARRESLSRQFGAWTVSGGTVARELFVQAYPDLVRTVAGVRPLLAAAAPLSADGTSELDPLESLSGEANAAVFSTDGRLVLFACSDKSVVLWDVPGRREQRRLIGHTGAVWSVALSSDGRYALSGASDSTVRLWDVATGRELLQCTGHAAPVGRVVLSPDARLAVSTDFDNCLCCWDLRTGRLLRRIHEPAASLPCAAFTPDGSQVAVAMGKTVRWYRSDLSVELGQLPEEVGPVRELAFASDGKLLACGQDDGQVLVWNLDTREKLWHWRDHHRSIRWLAFLPRAGALLAAGADHQAVIRELRTGAVVKRGILPGGPILAGYLTRDGTYLLAATEDRSVSWWPWESVLSP